MDITVTIPRGEELVKAADEVCWAFVEVNPGERTRFSDTLKDIMKGLPHGRIKASIGGGKTKNFRVPSVQSPENLPPAFICALVIVVTADWLWTEEPSPWLQALTAAHVIGMRLQERHPDISNRETALHFGETFSLTGGALCRLMGHDNDFGLSPTRRLRRKSL